MVTSAPLGFSLPMSTWAPCGKPTWARGPSWFHTWAPCGKSHGPHIGPHNEIYGSWESCGPYYDSLNTHGQHVGPSSILHGHQIDPITIPSTITDVRHMGPHQIPSTTIWAQKVPHKLPSITKWALHMWSHKIPHTQNCCCQIVSLINKNIRPK